MADYTCYRDGCRKKHHKRGLCDWHYDLWERRWPVELRVLAPSLLERAWLRVAITEDCWLWTGGTNPSGYGHLGVRRPDGRRTSTPAHRYFYELHFGLIPAGYEIDHLCRVRNCVNPNHLEAVTHAENMRRSVQRTGADHPNGGKTHCPQGHPYSGDNLYEHKGRRQCLACRSAHITAYRQRQRAEKAA